MKFAMRGSTLGIGLFKAMRTADSLKPHAMEISFKDTPFLRIAALMSSGWSPLVIFNLIFDRFFIYFRKKLIST